MPRYGTRQGYACTVSKSMHKTNKALTIFSTTNRPAFCQAVVFLSVIALFPVFAIAESTPSGAQISHGKQAYNETCTFCHQADAIGKPGVAPSLSNKELLSISSDKFLFETIRDGRAGTGMPPFSYMGDDVIKSIVAYLRSLATLPSRVKETDAQPKSTGNWRQGKKTYNNICLGCHGPKGNGYSAGGTGTAIGLAGFLDKVSDGYIRTTIKEGRSNTRMRSFQGPEGLANLSDEEIDDIIAYLRSLPGKKSGH